jgi:AcrR family transcriptional regulator
MPRGRRRGSPRTRETILEAALARFTDEGYDRASLRDIAADAGVDPSLIVHYFSTKETLFTEALHLPRISEALDRMLEAAGPGSEQELGAHIAQTLAGLWEGGALAPAVTALIRSAASNEGASRMLREFLTRTILGRIATRLTAPDPTLRAALVASQVIGVMMARFVLRLEPLASADPDLIARAIAPNLQHYLTGDLGGDREPDGQSAPPWS